MRDQTCHLDQSKQMSGPDLGSLALGQLALGTALIRSKPIRGGAAWERCCSAPLPPTSEREAHARLLRQTAQVTLAYAELSVADHAPRRCFQPHTARLFEAARFGARWISGLSRIRP